MRKAVGVAGFEPATTSTQSSCTTGLCDTPNLLVFSEEGMDPLAPRVAERFLASRPIALPEQHVRGLSKFIVKQVQRRMTDGDFRPGANILSTSITVPHVLGHNIEVLVHVLAVHSSGALVHGGGQGSASGKPVVVVQINGNAAPAMLEAAIKRGALESDVHDVLMHELTHAVDVVAKHDKGKVHGPEGHEVTDYKEYYNSPTEMRAYMGEIARMVVHTVKEYIDAGMAPKDAFTAALQDNERWAEMERFLTPSNKQHMLKGVWTAVQDAGHFDMKHAYKFVPKEKKQHKVDRLADIIRKHTGLSKGQAEAIADAHVRGRDVDGLAVQKSWPIQNGIIHGPNGVADLAKITVED